MEVGSRRVQGCSRLAEGYVHMEEARHLHIMSAGLVCIVPSPVNLNIRKG